MTFDEINEDKVELVNPQNLPFFKDNFQVLKN